MTDTLGLILFFITIIFSLYYALLIGKIWTTWDAIRAWIIPYGYSPTTSLSVVIAARDEQDCITECILSILKNKYPPSLLEIIIVDDHSTDHTIDQVLSLSQSNIVKVISARGKGKKNALSEGISHAKGKLIVCTDADCVVSDQWLSHIESFYVNSKARMVCGLINYSADKSLVQRFQFLDNLNTMATTATGITTKDFFLANGANIAFEKSLFEELSGYEGNLEYASGDDIFLVNKTAKKDTTSIKFLKSKESIVETQPQRSWSSLKDQRIRWASKSKGYSKSRIVKIQAIIFIFVLLLWVNVALSLFIPICLFSAVFALFIKWSIDYLYLSRMANYFDNRSPLKSFIPLSLIYLIYILAAGYWAMTKSRYRWKGRSVK